MSWIEVKSRYESGQDLSPFVDIYDQYGIENTLEEDAQLTGCLVDVEGSTDRIEELTLALKEAGALVVETRDLAEDNWEIAWRQFFKPRRFGNRFVVRPTWEEFDSTYFSELWKGRETKGSRGGGNKSISPHIAPQTGTREHS